MKTYQLPLDYFEQSGKLFQTLLYFMKEAKHRSPSILKLSKSDVSRFKLHILPGLTKILSDEAKHNTFNTLNDLLQLLLIYDEMVRIPKKKASEERKSQVSRLSTGREENVPDQKAIKK